MPHPPQDSSGYPQTDTLLRTPSLRVGAAGTEQEMPTLAGRFQVRGEIAHGGMGVVYSAHDPQFGREVAVKVLHERLRNQPDSVRRFDEESRITGQLQHPCIPAVFEVGLLGDGQPFLAMKLIKGRTLAELLEGSRPNRADLIPAFEQVCQAVAYAHSRHVIHRDLKPANVMVGAFGEVQVMDWGLAKVLGERRALEPTDPEATRDPSTKIHDPRTASNGSETQAGAMVGTPAYMPPEQAAGAVGLIDERADVFGLGAVLCVILTGKPPYVGEDSEAVRVLAVRGKLEECHARLEASGADPALVALAVRCLSPEVADRPRNAGEVAKAVAELRREAEERTRRAELDRVRAEGKQARAELQSAEERKHRRLQLALAASVVGFLLLAGTGAWWAQKQAFERETDVEKAKDAEAREAAAREREATAREREAIAREREVTMLSLQGERLLSNRKVGWFERLWPQIRKAAALRRDVTARNQAVATLQGLDAVKFKDYPNLVGASLAFDGKGRMLLGGDGKVGARFWDGSLDEPLTSKKPGYGPAAYRRNGTPVQFTTSGNDPYSFVFWDVQRQKELNTFKVPDSAGGKPPPDLGLRVALSTEADLAAVAIKLPNGKPILAIWDTETGKLLHRFDEEVSSLAFSPRTEGEAQFLAAGHPDGNVSVWSLPKGEKAVTVKVGEASVEAVAFGETTQRGDGKTERRGLSRWRLAAGQNGGNISIWDLGTRSVLSFCHGSRHNVHALAFSPDGMTLASAGRNEPRLWDVVTGKLLLELKIRGRTLAVAFSPDGKRLATSGREEWVRGGTEVWTLLPGRGVQTLRGLTARALDVTWSRDGRLVAALSNNWQVAVWDREANRLLHVFDAPSGLFADNARLAFSPDAKRLAFAGHRTARVWDITSGKQVRSWPLPIGLVDFLIYAGDDRLYSFRVETPDPNVGPYSGSQKTHPRICKIRNLFAKEDKPVEIKGFNWHVFGAAAAPSAKCFIVDGVGVVDRKGLRTVQAFDATTGKPLWSLPSTKKQDGAYLNVDSKGERIGVGLEDGSRRAILDAASGRLLEQRSGAPWAFAPEMRYWFQGDDELYSRGSDSYLFRVGIDEHAPGVSTFNWAGTHFTWQNARGDVNVCDLKAVKDRLTEVGLGW